MLGLLPHHDFGDNRMIPAIFVGVAGRGKVDVNLVLFVFLL